MDQVRIGMIGGSGLAAALLARSQGTPLYVNTPFGKPSGTILETSLAGVPVLLLARHGNGHTLGPSQVPYRANIFALKQLGCTHIIASGAVGSLREQFRPRDLVVVDQIIDKTHRRASTFFEHAAVHVEFANPFCPILRQILLESAASLALSEPSGDQPESGPQVHESGCYVAMEGPAFSTRAESLMHRLWGGDLIGMTAMPEAKLAREAEIPYALVALVTDYDCWRPHPKTSSGDVPPRHELLHEIISNLSAASNHAIRLMTAAVEKIASDPARLDACPATSALELAIWSEKSEIAPEEIERLAPLWLKYFR